MGNEASITVNQEGVKSFAAALWNPQHYEIFIDDQEIGVLNGYTNHKTCAISSGPHSVYVRAYARNSVSFTRVYGYSQTLEVNVSPGEDKRVSCGRMKGPPCENLSFSRPAIPLRMDAGASRAVPAHQREKAERLRRI